MATNGPFPWSKISTLNQAIAQLKHRSVRNFRHGMTIADLQMLLTKPKDRDVLAKASKIVTVTNGYTQTQQVYVPWGDYQKLTVNIAVDGGKDGFLLPNYVTKNGLQTDLSDDVKQRVDLAFARFIKSDLDWRYAQSVVEALCNRCKTASQVKLIMPTIVSLFRVQFYENPESVENDYADRLYAQSLPKEMPAIPPLLREWAVKVGGLITGASMLPWEAPKIAADGFKMSVHVMDKVTMPWAPDTELASVIGYGFQN